MQVAITEIRKANQTKARLDSALATGVLMAIDLNNQKDSTAFWKNIALKEIKRKKGWRKAAIISGSINLAENALLYLFTRK